MYCLVYQSVATREFGPHEIETMLNKAREYNHSQGITGCLLFYKGTFLQYLEGNQIRVLSLFDHIKVDKRHSEVRLLTHGQIEEREFLDWDMAYENLFGDNALINYLKLVVGNFLDDPLKKYNPNPGSTKFWDHVGQLLRSR